MSLCVSRFPGESIIIRTSDGIVTLTINDVRCKKVWLEFDAPKTIEINRLELDVVKHPGDK